MSHLVRPVKPGKKSLHGQAHRYLFIFTLCLERSLPILTEQNFLLHVSSVPARQLPDIESLGFSGAAAIYLQFGTELGVCSFPRQHYPTFPSPASLSITKHTAPIPSKLFFLLKKKKNKERGEENRNLWRYTFRVMLFRVYLTGCLTNKGMERPLLGFISRQARA